LASRATLWNWDPTGEEGLQGLFGWRRPSGEEGIQGPYGWRRNSVGNWPPGLQLAPCGKVDSQGLIWSKRG
jgi:hypothetical protein